MAESRKQTPSPAQPKFCWIQTVVGIVSVVVVGTLIIWIAVDLLVSEDTPPDLKVKTTQMEKVTSGWRVEFEVTNLASETAAEVGIDASLTRNREKVEEKSATLDYVPGHSMARGGLFFDQNPADFDLEISVGGYRKP